LREHNRKAWEISAKHPNWSDEQVFQSARKYLIALNQKIVIDDFLPEFLGRKLPSYKGYNPKCNAGLSNLFATAAYRHGHSMVNTHIDVVNTTYDNVNQIVRWSALGFGVVLIGNAAVSGCCFDLLTLA
jgi:hypothetical protein